MTPVLTQGPQLSSYEGKIDCHLLFIFTLPLATSFFAPIMPKPCSPLAETTRMRHLLTVHHMEPSANSQGGEEKAGDSLRLLVVITKTYD